MTGDDGYPMTHKPARGIQRECCPTFPDSYHNETCPNAHENDNWKALRAINEVLEQDDRATEDAGLRGAAPPSVAQDDLRKYRDLAEILRDEAPKIDTTVYSLLVHLGIDPDANDETEPYLATYKGMAQFYVANLILLRERNEMAHDAWRRTGWAGNLMTLWGKVTRLMYALWWHPNSDARSQKPLDHLGDAATYSGFTAVLFMAGDERGSER